jgi:hypothetical protein
VAWVLPFGRIALLLYLRKDTFSLVVGAMAALGHPAIAFDLLLPAHIASLFLLSDLSSSECCAPYPGNSSALGVVIVQANIETVTEVVALRQYRRHRGPVLVVGAEDLRCLLARERRYVVA